MHFPVLSAICMWKKEAAHDTTKPTQSTVKLLWIRYAADTQLNETLYTERINKAYKTTGGFMFLAAFIQYLHVIHMPT